MVLLLRTVQAEPAALPGTDALRAEGDLASQMIDRIDRFLLGRIAASVEKREAHFDRDFSSPKAYGKSLEPNRKRLAHILGLRDPRVRFSGLRLDATTKRPALLGESDRVRIDAVRWPAIDGVHGEGLLLTPKDRPARADVVCIPDCEQTPEMIAGVTAGVPPEAQFARRLAAAGCRVVVPLLIDRGHRLSVGFGGERPTKIPHREFLYRPAFELGRHLIGYELQKVLAVVDWFEREKARFDRRRAATRYVGVVGYGEGGMLALYAGALDPRIDVVAVSGYFDARQDIWREPLDRNVFGRLEQFGDAELASMIAPRSLIVEACKVPEVVIPAGTAAGPGRTVTPPLDRVRGELQRAEKRVDFEPPWSAELMASEEGSGPFATDPWQQAVLAGLKVQGAVPPPAKLKTHATSAKRTGSRLTRQFGEILQHTQRLLVESPYVRREFFSKVDRSGDLAKYGESIEPYRERFRREIIGKFDLELLPPAARSRKIYDEEKYSGYEVVLDVFPDVFAYGILLIPREIAEGEKRPVVVCQHGLEGRPVDVITREGRGYRFYKAFAARLAERGFITFAPQNIYIFGDRFRTLQRKANALGKTLFSIMVPQHRQILRWLATLPEVDEERIGFYGLSYGGKSAMRIPALVDGYALSICSADFNEWIWKNASVRSAYSYAYRGEYEIFEFDLGNTFNYAEMAALICPRPFMVERGHRDGVAPDEAVAYEYAKVRLLYTDLKIPERTEIEWFDGPHSIHGEGTFDFLHRHLKWPAPAEGGASQE